MSDKPEAIIEGEVLDALNLETELQTAETELMQDERFRAFLELQKKVTQSIAQTWKNIESQMIENDVKTIKGVWGSLTIAERTGFDIDKDTLPPRFWKKVPDETKIRNTYQLEGKAPKGTSPKVTKYLTKRLKGQLLKELNEGV